MSTCPRNDPEVLDVTVGSKKFFRGCMAARCPVGRIIENKIFPDGCALLLHALRWIDEEKAK